MSANPPFRHHAAQGGGLAHDPEAVVDELEELLVQGGAAVVATDLVGVITHWSAGAERLFGWSADEAIGRAALDLLVTPDDRPSAEANVETIRSTGGWEGEFELRRKAGGVALAYVRGTLIKDDAGRPVGLLALSMDLSPRPPV